MQHIPSKSGRRQHQAHGRSSPRGHWKRDHGRGVARPPSKAGAMVPDGALAALQDLIKDPEAKMYWKVLSGWLLVQAGCTLRFDDHRAFSRRTWS